jgi:hypothetical protein
MHQRIPSPRQVFRQLEMERLALSATLEATFENLKTLTLELSHFRAERPQRGGSSIKYRVNLTHAKSLFRFNCPNDECVGGDFDLSEALADAVASKAHKVVGEVLCQGWRSQATIGDVHCHNLLRYTLLAEYRTADGPPPKLEQDPVLATRH